MSLQGPRVPAYHGIAPRDGIGPRVPAYHGIAPRDGIGPRVPAYHGIAPSSRETARAASIT